MQLVFVLGLSVFLFLNLTFAISSQFMFFPIAFASSNNIDANEDDESNRVDSNGNADEDFLDNQNQLQDTNNDETSNEKEQQSTETLNNPNDTSSEVNNPDTNMGFLDSEAIDKDTLKDKDVRSANIEPAEIRLVVRSYDISKYFGEEKANDIGKTISFCAETLTSEGNTIWANPHCLSGLNITERLQVEPGQIKIGIQYSPQIHIDSESKYCTIDHLDPKQSKPCAIIFKPNSIQEDIIPKPNSNFGKSMVGP